MLIQRQKFRMLVQGAMQKAGMTAQMVADKANVGKSTVYRLLNGEGEKMRKEEVEAIAHALELEIGIVGNDVVELRKDRRDYEKVSQSRESKIRGIIDMLRDVDAETLDLAMELVEIVVSLQKTELFELRDLIEIIRTQENKQIFIEKLQAVVKLLIPYQGIVERNDEEKRKIRLPVN